MNVNCYLLDFVQKFDDLWDILDPNSDSFLHYDEFMRAFIGEMNEYRKSYVIKVYHYVIVLHVITW